MPLSRASLLTLGLALAAPLPAWAACSVSADPVAFGTIDVTRTSTGTGAVIVRCDAAASFEVGISPGRSGGEPRQMAGPQGGRLDYYLFADAGHSVPWGDGQAIGGTRSGRSDGAATTRLVIYGVVPPQPGVPAGEYIDSLQVTLTF
ncbi:spore coat U domain-containing protein [Benzoatithermus flavus]|uniref:Spore coat U domain-containing protein n=1 Tax=Benzoatithermus flavus TaxID=3108223 RepID=A0ABU8XM47_9PROT